MRRIITEWGMALSALLLVAVTVLGIDSVLTKWSQEPLSTAPNVYMNSENGRICFFSELGENGKPKLIETGKWASMPTRQYTNWRLPGIEYNYRQFTIGHVVWSLEISLLIPLAICVMIMAICWRFRRRSPSQ